DDDDLEGFSE
nr:RecName: Full=Toxin To39; AltName: Full=Toxin Tc39 [Tityus obscurus]